MPIGRNDEHAGFLGADVLLTSLPEEQNPEQFDSHGSRRPSTTSSHHGSPLTPSRKTMQSQGARRVESSPTTDYGREKTPVHAAKSPLLSSPKGSPTPTKKSGGLVSGLKKRLGGTLRSTGAAKETAGKLPPSNSWAGSPTPATDEVQIVSADSMSKLDSPSLGAVAARATLSSQSSRGHPPFAHEFGAAEADMSVDGKWLARTASKDRMNGSTDSLSSRLFNKKRSSGLFSHSRNSSRTSIIEHTSFDEVRRQSGVYSGAASLSSQQNLHMPSLARTSVFGGSEEEREELQGDYSPFNGSYDLPHQARPLRSPIRPERMLDDSSKSLPVGIHANRASLESSFNAAHDKRWSTVGPSFRSERRGSESGLPRASFTMRRGSDVGIAGYGSSSRGVDHHKHDSVSSIHSKRSSLLQNLSEDALVPSKPAKGNRRSLAGQTSQRWSDMILAPRTRKLSASSVQISRPTSIVGGPSASMADEISAEDEYKNATSSTELVAQRLRKKQEQLGRKPIPPPIYAMQQLSSALPPFNVRQSRSAGGRVEYPSAAASPFTHIGHGNETEPSTFLVQQQSAPKRPTFGLDMPPDAAAAFDCIPSPEARRIRTSSTPALLGLSISGFEGASAVGINGHADISRRTGGWEEAHDDEGEEEEEELLLPEEADLEALDSAIHLPYQSDAPSPRPLPSDTPRSPQMDEVELLADEGSPDGTDGNGGRAPPIRTSPSLPPLQSDLPRKHSQDSLSCSSQQQARRVARPSYSFV